MNDRRQPPPSPSGAAAGTATPRDYRGTVFLPATSFPMKADLPKREPHWLDRWARLDLWARLRAQSKARPLFVLHDGPPYANGNLHIGHALNKILKDVINRAAQMAGRDADYIPGWDCHGLPIEWKVEEEYRAKGKDKDACASPSTKSGGLAAWAGCAGMEWQSISRQQPNRARVSAISAARAS